MLGFRTIHQRKGVHRATWGDFICGTRYWVFPASGKQCLGDVMPTNI